MQSNYPFPAEAPKPVQIDADLLLEANLGNFENAILQAREFQTAYSDLHDTGHWWLVELRLKSMQRIRKSCGTDRWPRFESDLPPNGRYS